MDKHSVNQNQIGSIFIVLLLVVLASWSCIWAILGTFDAHISTNKLSLVFSPIAFVTLAISSLFIVRKSHDTIHPALLATIFLTILLFNNLSGAASLQEIAAVTSGLISIVVGICVGSNVPLRPPKVSLNLPRKVSLLFLLLIVGLCVIGVGTFVANQGGVLAWLRSAYLNAIVLQEEGAAGIYIIPQIIVMVVPAMFIVAGFKRKIAWVGLILGTILCLIMMQRSSLLLLWLNVFVVRHYLYKRAPAIVMSVGLVLLWFILVAAGQLRHQGESFEIKEVGAGGIAGRDSNVSEVFRLVISENVRFHDVQNEGSSIKNGVKFLLPQFLAGIGEYKTIGQSISSLAGGTARAGIPPTIIGAMYIYFGPAFGLLGLFIAGFVAGMIYSGAVLKARSRRNVILYCAFNMVAFKFARTGDLFVVLNGAVVVFVIYLAISIVLSKSQDMRVARLS